ncbi:AAA domain-containing protein [Haloplasma contractile]|uniref:DNA replication ATP-dependent helicase Dna2 protein n=1 Tax=Haloplasma contractile SSD-17B TaxID=1033810 RepID=U2DTW7_9MOLU|nr:AAA domain-containing protein [Haloplasma contractile]ERJ11902.1 DNA replication ATP-dependent helicase Dna2 protein [Haloplasma contractile SSD-17B]
MSKKGVEISKAIKEGKWLTVEYQNEKGDTRFWCAIKDIHPKYKKFEVEMFNHEMYERDHNKGYMASATVYFNKFKSVRVIEETTYEKPEYLIDKIINNYEQFRWLDFYMIEEKVLNYYETCYKEDSQLYERKYTELSGLDTDSFKRDNNIKLNNDQFKNVVKHIKINQKELNKKHGYKKIKLGINTLAIASNVGIIPIRYYELLLDVTTKTLKASDLPKYNIETSNFKLSRYIDESTETFIDQFDDNREYYIESISNNLKRGHVIDERPYVFQFTKRFMINLRSEYKAIQTLFSESQLTRPLKAFFGAVGTINQRRKKHQILLSDTKVNLSQLRVIYNSVNQDVTYVQGPPGTGKTTTIFNTLLTAFYNDLTVLITSNNNEAINGIYRKFEALCYKGNKTAFPILRLGNNDEITKTLRRVKKIYQTLPEDFENLDRTLDVLEDKIQTDIKKINRVLKDYEEREVLIEKISAIENMIKIFNENKELDEFVKFNKVSKLEEEKGKLSNELKGIKEIDEFEIINLLQVDEAILSSYLFYKSLKRWMLLKESSYKSLREIILMSDTDADNVKKKVREFNDYIRKSNNLRKVLRVFPTIISTNISAYKLGEPKPVFDLLIMDEAGQCDVAKSLIPLTRAERALFVGDPNQLKPIILLSDYRNKELKNTYQIPNEYDYKDNSILSTMLQVDKQSLYILLKDHYRCAKEIINFSNKKYYDDQLILNTESNVEALRAINVDGFSSMKRNTSITEVDSIVQEIKNTYACEDIGIITPFRNQAELIKERMQKEGMNDVKVGTIHTFQGNEKDKIIMSLGITSDTHPKAFDWVKNNKELINVATTRAKNELVVISDLDEIKKLSKKDQGTNDLVDLISYIGNTENVIISGKTDEIFKSKVSNFKQFNSKAEQELLDTVSHFITINDRIKVESKKKVTDVLDVSNNDDLFLYANQAHFDFVLYNHQMQPLLAIEVMGIEHYTDQQVKSRDYKKHQICKKHNLEIFTIKNDYVRRYNLIKDTILKILK